VDARHVRQICEWEANANVPRFYHIRAIRGKNRSRQWSSRGQNCTKKICLCRGSVPDSAGGVHSAHPDPLAGGERDRIRASAHYLPFPGKNPVGNHGDKPVTTTLNAVMAATC